MYRLTRVTIIFFALTVSVLLPWAAIAASQSSAIEQTFQKAKKDYLQKNMESAGQQIEKGASYMKTEAAKASVRGKEALTASAEELEKLAYDVKKGAVKSRKRIEETFARAYLALALESHIQSTESWAKKEAAKVSESLEAVAANLERSFAWAGRKIEKSTKDVVKKSKDLSLKLKEKGAAVTDEVGKGLTEAGSEIEKFSKSISPK